MALGMEQQVLLSLGTSLDVSCKLCYSLVLWRSTHGANNLSKGEVGTLQVFPHLYGKLALSELLPILKWQTLLWVQTKIDFSNMNIHFCSQKTKTLQLAAVILSLYFGNSLWDWCATLNQQCIAHSDLHDNKSSALYIYIYSTGTMGYQSIIKWPSLWL